MTSAFHQSPEQLCKFDFASHLLEQNIAGVSRLRCSKGLSIAPKQLLQSGLVFLSSLAQSLQSRMHSNSARTIKS